MKIPTYLSHSYRTRDQSVNREFWRLFGRSGFFFDVDPPSNVTIHAHLERMLRRSGCFVAIVNYRQDAGPPFCSRFILYEFGLAVQARIPKLVLIDDRITDEGSPFQRLHADEKHYFSFHEPLAGIEKLNALVKGLKARSRSVASRARGPIGLIVPSEPGQSVFRDPSIREQLDAIAHSFGFVVRELSVPFEQNAEMALALEACEALVLDVTGRELPDWVFGYVHGRLLPSIKLVQVPAGKRITGLRLPPLVEGLRMDPHEPLVESVTYWRDDDDLLHQFGQALQKLNEEPTRLDKPREGEIYFRSIGRRPTRIFLSNAGADNELAKKLSELLRLNSIEHFHYKQEDDIPTGSYWKDKIRHELDACQLFVALIGPTYNEKPWCVEELRVALRRKDKDGLAVLPYKVGSDNVILPALRGLQPIQLTDRLEKEDLAAGKILRAIDRFLKREDDGSEERRQPTLLGGSNQLLVDELRTLSVNAWTSVLDELRSKGIGIRALPHTPAPRSRLIAEELIAEVQRAVPIGGTVVAGSSVLALLVDSVCRRIPKSRRASIRKIATRLRTTMAAEN